MAKATYENIQGLKASIAQLVSAFTADFPSAHVKVAFQCDLLTQHGNERIKVSIADIPPVQQGRLPDMNAEDDEPTPLRRTGTARTFPGDG